MALVKETGAGLSTANAYTDLTAADLYFADRLYTETWDAATDANKDKALILATTLIDNYFTFQGERASTTQALQWPRASVYDRDGNLLPSDAIPANLAKATAEFAQSLLVEDRTQPDSKAGMTRLKADSLELEWDAARKPTRTTVPNLVVALLSDLGRSSQGYCRTVGRS